MPTVPTDELIGWLEMARDGGFAAAVHAIGDEANRLALDAFAATGATGRDRACGSCCARSTSRGLAELGVAASVQPEQAMDDRDVAERYWEGRTGRAYAYRALHDAGATMAFGSDAPRRTPRPVDHVGCGGHPIPRRRAARHPEQAVPIEIALASSARTTIEVGQLGGPRRGGPGSAHRRAARHAGRRHLARRALHLQRAL